MNYETLRAIKIRSLVILRDVFDGSELVKPNVNVNICWRMWRRTFFLFNFFIFDSTQDTRAFLGRKRVSIFLYPRSISGLAFCGANLQFHAYWQRGASWFRTPPPLPPSPERGKRVLAGGGAVALRVVAGFQSQCVVSFRCCSICPRSRGVFAPCSSPTPDDPFHSSSRPSDDLTLGIALTSPPLEFGSIHLMLHRTTVVGCPGCSSVDLETKEDGYFSDLVGMLLLHIK